MKWLEMRYMEFWPFLMKHTGIYFAGFWKIVDLFFIIYAGGGEPPATKLACWLIVQPVAGGFKFHFAHKMKFVYAIISCFSLIESIFQKLMKDGPWLIMVCYCKNDMKEGIKETPTIGKNLQVWTCFASLHFTHEGIKRISRSDQVTKQVRK